MSLAPVKSSEASFEHDTNCRKLADHEFDAVAGGKEHQASPNLFKLCCNGKHFPSATM